MRLSRVLVTGANGFIGRAVCQYLENAGFNVRAAVRNLDDGVREILPDVKDFCEIKDIGPDAVFGNALNGVDAVVHLAARVHVMKEWASDPLVEFRKVNTIGTKRLYEEAMANGVKKFIFISTVKVNGEKTTNRPFTEHDTPRPQDSYSTSKLEAEEILTELCEYDSPTAVTILRIPLVYGPFVKGNFLRLLEITSKNIPLPLKNVNNRRSMLYVGNLASAIETTLHDLSKGVKTYMVSDTVDISTPKLITMISKEMGKDPILLPFPVPLLRLAGALTGFSDELDRLLGSLTVSTYRIKLDLNWSPPYDVSYGIRDMVQWFTSKTIKD
ncbi:MAG: NAD-dependent epimerase/dehydratase family protein [Nitrospirae bacterium]|nr:NAD-dependent epimerase/dehydratase family protein [Nitrospirota bacterium]MBF0533955.1 NAD-dependent epimerase/dehydratase family protein [Nitrospirota bacterium]MBF0616114.1 NAD-dependent epimerase/dehydratase family protein [Nitrospirota bacterium]